MFVHASQLTFLAEKLRSQKQKQTVNLQLAFGTLKIKLSEEMN
jgi:hypothetical protein